MARQRDRSGRFARIRPNTDKIIQVAAATLYDDLKAFGSVFAYHLKRLAPPPPKFGDIPHTGHNRDSIDYSIEKRRKSVVLKNYTESGYGGWLDIGTSRMEARPYFIPAFNKAKEDWTA
jgi:hypothetical protein